MRSQLQQILEILEQASVVAAERAENSERDATIEKYEEVQQYIDEAVNSIQEALARLDEK